MANRLTTRRDQAVAIWRTAVAAARPEELVQGALAGLMRDLPSAPPGRILVVGAGKAGAAMAAGAEAALANRLDRVHGLLNVPAESVRRLQTIELHAARPAGTNQPTAEGVEGTRRILDLLAGASADDVALCLLSGGGSALLPAPVEGTTLDDKQQVTRLLHACGATINEMNTVRKHLSRCKGGRLAQVFRGRALYSLIVSDVIGDPLDVIASGPTAADPTTFADALGVLEKYRLTSQVPASVLAYLRKGTAGDVPETLKVLPAHVSNRVIGNNARSLMAAEARAREFGYPVLNLGSYIEGETRHVAVAMAGIVRSILAEGRPAAPPLCLLSGGETTVTLAADHGLGGRNQEFVLALADKLGPEAMRQVVILSGGTDGEDGPTDAAGAIADADTLNQASRLGLTAASYLARNDAYRFFEAAGGLLKTGLTQTNVMDVRVVLVGQPRDPANPAGGTP